MPPNWIFARAKSDNPKFEINQIIGVDILPRLSFGPIAGKSKGHQFGYGHRIVNEVSKLIERHNRIAMAESSLLVSRPRSVPRIWTLACVKSRHRACQLNQETFSGGQLTTEIENET